MSIQIRGYLRIFLVLIIFGFGLYIFIGFHNEKSDDEFTMISSNKQFRGVIVTLIRSTNYSISLVINMIHSVIQFYPSNNTFPYPFIIFHDENFTIAMRQYILSCILTNHKQINISFALVNFHTDIKPNVDSHKDKPIGYRLMCRFWAYDVFYHPEILQGHYDYLMRMDDDSYFFDNLPEDLFSYMHQENLDYIYRSYYAESTESMDPIERLFTNSKSIRTLCIYNNFFIIRLNWFYESKLVQTFLQELIRNDLILREYIGDGCIHAAMLDIDKQVKKHHIKNIPYGHNIHLMRINHEHYQFIIVEGFSEEIYNSCQQLTVIDGMNNQLKKISFSHQLFRRLTDH